MTCFAFNLSKREREDGWTFHWYQGATPEGPWSIKDSVNFEELLPAAALTQLCNSMLNKSFRLIDHYRVYKVRKYNDVNQSVWLVPK